MELRLRIGFFAESCLPFHGLTLEERPLGGTETGVIRLAEALQILGHDVTVFTSVQNPPNSSPTYLHAGKIQSSGTYDALVIVKDPRPLAFNLPAKKVFFLTGDGPDQYINYGLGDKRMASRLSALLTVSDWQGQVMSAASGFPIELCRYIGNGVHLPYFEGSETRQRKRLIFASAPYRGLDVAYNAFIDIQKRHPDAEFHIFAGFDLYNTDKPFSGPLVAQFQKLKELISKNPGCIFHGNVTQKELAREYMKSSILLYPNTINETCCIVALEAQAAGCPVVSSNNSGISESVRDGGIVVNGVPGSPDYMQEMHNVLHALLSDNTYWENLSRSARSKDLSWESVAKRFLGNC